MKRVKFAGYPIRVPNHPLLRIALGVLLVIGSVFSFLPILGIWMLPLGLIVLSVDFAIIRRFRRWFTIKFGYWMIRRWPNAARRIGYGPIRSEKMRRA
jgi:hypothetical protein